MWHYRRENQLKFPKLFGDLRGCAARLRQARGVPLNNADSDNTDYLRFFAARSRSSLSAVRFFAAARDAFLARSERSAAVIFLAEVLPPNAPVLRAISAIAARTSGEILIAMSRWYT